eukprot:TRINITY_DN2161_c0_g3_i1.p2 TRINITY_DN2161_c0_g3~~TRINITY_DN2161_c0_g3_i1.p2  ORF type:complete len:184 (+),score=30.17 TRINITY_DN2161_c0_g3_i1:422-973(+)
MRHCMQKNFSCKSTATNSIACGPHKSTRKNIITGPTPNNNTKFQPEVIRLKPTSSMKKLFKGKDVVCKASEQSGAVKSCDPVKEAYNTNPLLQAKILSNLKFLYLPKKMVVNRHEGRRSRNPNAAKHETCIVKDYAMPIEPARSQRNVVGDDSQESIDCKTVIEYACDNNYSLICSSINELFT